MDYKRDKYTLDKAPKNQLVLVQVAGHGMKEIPAVLWVDKKNRKGVWLSNGKEIKPVGWRYFPEDDVTRNRS